MATSSASLDRSPRKNWVEKAGGLDSYHRKIARAIHEKRGRPLDEAIKFALGRLKRWAAGGDGVTAETKAKAAKAVAHWERIKGKANLQESPADTDDGLDLADVDLIALADNLDDPLDVQESPLSLRLREDAPVGFEVGDPVRESSDDHALGRSGTVTAEHVDEGSGAFVYDVAWQDGTTSERVGQFDLRNVKDLRESPLDFAVDAGDLALLEAAAKAPLSNAKRKAGESVTDWGRRLKRGDRRNEERIDGQKRTGETNAGALSDAEFERAHPRGRGGRWIMKQGASGQDVRVVQRRVGAKADGTFGAGTRQKVMDFQRRHGLVVDGIVGRQTIAAMRGDADAADIKPGRATAADRRWLAARARRRADLRETPATGALALPVGADMRLVEAPDPRIHEEADLVLVETVDGTLVARDLALVESAAPGDALFNEDGTIDFVIIRPCHGRGIANAIYEASMLERDAHVFTGWPSYDNHESPEAKRARRGLPRPPSELAGEIRESFWDPNFETPHDGEMGWGRGAVIGRFMLTEEMERLVRRLPRAVKTSVNAQATKKTPVFRRGRRGMLVEGIVNDPENCSVDLVTKAGAGGQVANLFRELAAA